MIVLQVILNQEKGTEIYFKPSHAYSRDMDGAAIRVVVSLAVI